MAASRAQVNLNKAPALPAAQNFAELQAQMLTPAELESQVSALRDKISNSSNRTKTAQFKTQLRDLTYSQEVLKRQVADVGAYTQKLNNVKAAESAYNRNPNPNTGKIYNDALSMALVVPDMPDKRGVKKANPAAQSLDIAAQDMGFDTAAASEKVNQMVAKGHVTREAADSWFKTLTGALTAGAAVAGAGAAIAMGGTALLGSMAPTTGGATAAGGAGALGGTSSVAAANPLMAANAASQAGVGGALTSGGNLMAANAAGQVGMGSALANAGITAASSAPGVFQQAGNWLKDAAGNITSPTGAGGGSVNSSGGLIPGISNDTLLKGAGLVASGVMGSNAATDSANTQAQAAQAAISQQQAMYDQNRADAAPWRDAGVSALGQLSEGMAPGGNLSTPYGGADPTYTPSVPAPEYQQYQTAAPEFKTPGTLTPPWKDFSTADFQADPGYQFRMQEQQRALDNRQSAAGTVFSGEGLKEAMRYSGGLADQTYQDAFNRYNQNQQGNLQFNQDAYNRDILNQQQGLGFQQAGFQQDQAQQQAGLQFNQNAFNQNQANQQNELQFSNNAFNRYNQNQTNQYNRLAGISGTGQQANQQIGQLGANTANNTANLTTSAGAAQAAGQMGATNAWTNAISQGFGMYNQNQQNQQQNALLSQILGK